MLFLGASACNKDNGEELEQVETASVSESSNGRSTPAPDGKPAVPVDPLDALCLPAWDPSPTVVHTEDANSNLFEQTIEIYPGPEGGVTNEYIYTKDANTHFSFFDDGTEFRMHLDFESIYARTNLAEVYMATGLKEETVRASDGAVCVGQEIISTVLGDSPVTQFVGHVECPGGGLTVIDRRLFERIKTKLGL